MCLFRLPFRRRFFPSVFSKSVSSCALMGVFACVSPQMLLAGALLHGHF